MAIMSIECVDCGLPMRDDERAGDMLCITCDRVREAEELFRRGIDPVGSGD